LDSAFSGVFSTMGVGALMPGAPPGGAIEARFGPVTPAFFDW